MGAWISCKGGGESSRLMDVHVRRSERFQLKVSMRGFSTSQLLVDFLPQILVSSSAAGGGGSLTQAGDVCLAAWWSHDALGVSTGNVVIDLSTCGNERKDGL